ncbi:MAG: rhomboid family intramembrane serine protease [Planctomycetota bacterium]
MGFRPNWYENEGSRKRMSWSGPAHWTGVGWLLALIGVGFLLQMIVPQIVIYGSLRAWWPGGTEPVFNFGFPIQLITYAFFHAGFWHIFGNCLFLWIFGPELEASYGKRGFLRLFFGGAVLGGLLQWAYWLFAGSGGFVLGASGGVFALLVLYALKWPHRTIYLNFLFPIPVWVLAGGYVLLNVLSFIRGTAGGTSVLAHIGGALFALLWWRRGDVVGHISVQRKRAKAERVEKETSTDRREMDRILAKIQSSGLSSLDSRERSFLEKRSRELREGRG